MIPVAGGGVNIDLFKEPQPDRRTRGQDAPRGYYSDAAYRCYEPRTHRIVKSRDVVFLEDDLPLAPRKLPVAERGENDFHVAQEPPTDTPPPPKASPDNPTIKSPLAQQPPPLVHPPDHPPSEGALGTLKTRPGAAQQAPPEPPEPRTSTQTTAPTQFTLRRSERA
ncbi:hypothetical protein HETIRDRAFT_423716 [Heterobasidion irregulare TC 32-1]|uniref:Retroviral polymerase SH3-like domain-containing protein n=1 Tax=Heterobasidion irregulare (strain TC 32-1) TaxID=747525 RepID=W4KL40_HETIT|nr:uncharacterized protein HETIRDRAFT_423716 [Heterobasidion irregulare TC 32-1]ETW86542.1 hypothetical protein HETIRDRAFT_423716 [Heterobasidion irregulare TC 32-1]